MSKKKRQPKNERHIIVRAQRRKEVDLRRLGQIGMQFHQAHIEVEARQQVPDPHAEQELPDA